MVPKGQGGVMEGTMTLSREAPVLLPGCCSPVGSLEPRPCPLGFGVLHCKRRILQKRICEISHEEIEDWGIWSLSPSDP